MRTRSIVAVGLFVLAAAPGWCEQATPLPPHSTSYYLLRAVASLIIVIALILLTYYALKKLSWPQPRALTGGPVELLQVLPVEAGRRIYLIGIKERVWIIAWSQDAVALIGEMERAEVDETRTTIPGD